MNNWQNAFNERIRQNVSTPSKFFLYCFFRFFLINCTLDIWLKSLAYDPEFSKKTFTELVILENLWKSFRLKLWPPSRFAENKDMRKYFFRLDISQPIAKNGALITTVFEISRGLIFDPPRLWSVWKPHGG